MVKVLCCPAESMSEHFHIASTRNLIAHLITEVVDRQRASHRKCLGNVTRHEVIETIRNRHILSNVHSVQDITSCGGYGDQDIETVTFFDKFGRAQLHFSAEIADGVWVNLNANDGTDLTHFSLSSSRAQSRCGFMTHEGGLCAEVFDAHAAFLVHHVHRFHREGISTVLAKHGDHSVEYDMSFGQVSRSTLNEHVSRVKSDAGVATVNNGR
mmetsp:Transcript_4989/g.6445  ORF Transcript_4989/g.6445 Transcript_4989/m.6445 type:complete len:212 (-) Transcript_4989:730-1365(-)